MITGKIKTAWCLPGRGETIGELVRWSGIVPLPVRGYDESQKTNLSILVPGPPEEHDRDRVRQVLRDAGLHVD